MPGCRARPRRTRDVTRTGPGRRGRCGTVAAILANPRYTGRQVWNRQRTDFDLVDPANTTLGHKQVQRWNLPDGWVISRHPAHAALVSEADFIAAQDTAVPRGPARPGCASVPAGRAHRLRAVRAAAGIILVQRQARVPVPARPHQRHRPRTRPAEEHLRPRGPDPAAPGCPRHPPDAGDSGRRSGAAQQVTAPRRRSEPDRPAASLRRHPHLRPGHLHASAPATAPRRGHCRPRPLTPAPSSSRERRKPGTLKRPAAAGGRGPGDDPACPETAAMGI